MMDLPYTVDELVQATKDTVRATGLPSCYIRPIAYYGYGEMGLNTLPCTVDVAIACWPWGAYLGADAVSKGVRMKISSWARHDHNVMPPASKTTGNYVNSSLAKVEALKAGYDEAVMLNPDGYVSECTGENIFVARNGMLITPPISAGALEGITQDSVMTIARDHGYDCRVDQLTRSDLYIAEEMFVCGTAAEVSAVNSVDDRRDPVPGADDLDHRRRSTRRPSAARPTSTRTGVSMSTTDDDDRSRPGSRSTTRRCATARSSRASRSPSTTSSGSRSSSTGSASTSSRPAGRARTRRTTSCSSGPSPSCGSRRARWSRSG